MVFRLTGDDTQIYLTKDRGNHRKNHHARAIGPIDAIHTDPAACAVDPVEAIRHRRRDRRLRTKE